MWFHEWVACLPAVCDKGHNLTEWHMYFHNLAHKACRIAEFQSSGCTGLHGESLHEECLSMSQEKGLCPVCPWARE